MSKMYVFIWLNQLSWIGVLQQRLAEISGARSKYLFSYGAFTFLDCVLGWEPGVIFEARPDSGFGYNTPPFVDCSVGRQGGLSQCGV